MCEIVVLPSAGVQLRKATPEEEHAAMPTHHDLDAAIAEIVAVREWKDEQERAAMLERHCGIQVLTELVDQFGVESVVRWLKNIAAIHGRDLQ